MNDKITPVGVPIGPMRRRPGQPHRQSRSQGEESDSIPPDAIAPAYPSVPLETPLPSDTPNALIPDTLFTASLLGQRMLDLDRALHALHMAGNRRWSPPDSTLNLADRTI